MSRTLAEAVPVVTAFLYQRGNVLLLRRSQRVGTYRGQWAGVSGYLERQPLAQARREMAQELRVSPRQAALRGIGVPLPVADEPAGHTWLVFPFLFRLRDGARLRLNWESAEAQWFSPGNLAALDTVPGLAKALARVWPPWGGPRLWDAMEAIAVDTTTGATDLALRGMRALGRLRGAQRWRGLRAFSALHPSMGVFPHVAARAWGQAVPVGVLARELSAATDASAERAAKALPPCRRVLTHSGSRACRETLVRWAGEGREAVVTESRPKLEGVALARELVAAGLRVTLITDAQIGLWARRCDAVLVGADAITTDGDLVNKAGTRLAALAAREVGTPVYAVAQTFKVCPPGWPVALMPQEPSEVARVRGARVANIAFEATPLSWFRAVFTERGALTPSVLGGVRKTLARGAVGLMGR